MLCQGMAFIIPSNIGVSIQAEGHYRYITICMKNKWKEYLKHLEFKNYFLTFSTSEKIHRMCTNYIKNGSAKTFVQSIIVLMHPVTVKCSKKFEKKEINSIVKAAGEYIFKHADEKFNLDALAGTAHASKYYLVKLFKKEMGVTPNQYYIQAKIRMAKKKIIDQQKEVDVATELNFNDQSYLCNLFKRQMGISLQNYKKSFRKL
jgi:AraC-like DNA-binding protein